MEMVVLVVVAIMGDQDLEEAEVVVEEAEVVADAFLLTPWYGRKTNHLQTRLQLK